MAIFYKTEVLPYNIAIVSLAIYWDLENIHKKYLKSISNIFTIWKLLFSC